MMRIVEGSPSAVVMGDPLIYLHGKVAVWCKVEPLMNSKKYDAPGIIEPASSGCQQDLAHGVSASTRGIVMQAGDRRKTVV